MSTGVTARNLTSASSGRHLALLGAAAEAGVDGVTTMPALKYHDVFVPGGYPRHTYNPRIELQLEQRLSESRRNLCKLVTVVGQTKSAKTVLARKVLPRDECVWVDGGTVAAESEENRAVVQGSIAYFGTYSLNETEKV